jgi:hypothetical protein
MQALVDIDALVGDVNVDIGLADLPIRSWFASPRRWTVVTICAAGEAARAYRPGFTALDFGQEAPIA